MSNTRQIIPVVFGEGIDRQSGKTILGPGAMRDVRNFFLSPGKAQVRPGLLEVSTFEDELGNPMTDILAGEASRLEAKGIVVGYCSTTGRVHVFLTEYDGTNPVLLQHETGSYSWFDLTAGDAAPTIITASAEGKVFLAHSARFVLDRADTVYYDPTYGEYFTLRSDLDAIVAGSTTGTIPAVKFRGVATYRDYLIGWGWGSHTDQDRPEIMRTSLPGRPTEFRSEHYTMAGQRNEPILMVRQTNNVAVVFKENELHRFFGYSRANFGILPLDPLHGLVGPRLTMFYEGLTYFWSASGPRATDGSGPSVDLGIKLDLLGFEPADLARECELRTGFAALRLYRKVLEFVFGQLSYSLSFLEPGSPKWSYQQYAVPLNCFFRLYQSETFAASISGYPKCVPSTSWRSGAIADQAVEAKVEHISPPAGGILELWAREDGDPWPSSPTEQVKITVGKYQTVSTGGLTPNTLHDIAWRYRLGTSYATGYTLDDPDTWPAASVCLGSFTTTDDLRYIESAVWSRTGAATEQILLTWSGGNGANNTDVQKSTDGVTFAATVGSPVAAPATTFAYAPTAGEPETHLWFRVKDSTGSIYSNVVKVWVGPPMPLGFIPGTTTAQTGQPPRASTLAVYDLSDPTTPILSSTEGALDVSWENAVANGEKEFDIETEVGGVSAVYATVATFGDEATTFELTRTEGLVRTRLRHKVTASGTDDWSDYTPWTPWLAFPGIP